MKYEDIELPSLVKWEKKSQYIAAEYWFIATSKKEEGGLRRLYGTKDVDGKLTSSEAYKKLKDEQANDSYLTEKSILAYVKEAIYLDKKTKTALLI